MTPAAAPRSAYRYTTKDILTIAVIAAVGGVVGVAVVGPWAKLIEGLLGPFGGALNNFLHIFWPILTFLIIRKPGVIFLTSILYAAVEVLLGGVDGALQLVFMAMQGGASEAGMALFRYRPSIPSVLAAGAGAGIGCAVGILYVFGFVTTLSAGLQAVFIATMAGADAVLGGTLAWTIARRLRRVGAFNG